MSSGPTSIVVAADGIPWFTETTANKIGYVNGLGIVGHKTIPTANTAPWGITARGAEVWFTESNTGNVGMVSAGAAVIEYYVGLTMPHDIVYQGHYRFWVTDAGASAIACLDFSCFIGCGFTGEVMNTTTGSAAPDGVVLGPDDHPWFTELNVGKLATCDYYGWLGWTSTEFPAGAAGSQPHRIVVGPEGLLWFTEKSANKIGRMKTDGTQLTEFPIPTPNSQPYGITVGPGGYLYFTEEAGNKIGRIRGDGAIVEYTIPTANSGPTGIAVDPYGTVWFTEKNASKIGSLLQVHGDTNGDGEVDVSDVFYLINFLFAGGPAPL